MSPSELTRETARDAAREELSRQEYADAQPPFVLRVVGRALEALGDVLDALSLAAPGGAPGLVLLLLLLAGLVGVVLYRTGPLARRGPGRSPLFAGSPVLTADEHRARAEAAAAAGDHAEAVRERLRAVVRDLEARGALDARPGRTAGEVARDGGAAVPDVADDLRRAAVVFDEVWYGGRTADAAAYAVLVGVDERVRGSRLALR